MATFIEKLQNIMNTNRANAVERFYPPADQRASADAISRLEYAGDEEQKAVAQDQRGYKGFVYTPIAWADSDGSNLKSGYIITDNGRYGNKVFGLESETGESFSPSGTRNLLNSVLNRGGKVIFSQDVSVYPESMQKERQELKTKGNPFSGVIGDNASQYVGGSFRDSRETTPQAMNFLSNFRGLNKF